LLLLLLFFFLFLFSLLCCALLCCAVFLLAYLCDNFKLMIGKEGSEAPASLRFPVAVALHPTADQRFAAAMRFFFLSFRSALMALATGQLSTVAVSSICSSTPPLKS